MKRNFGQRRLLECCSLLWVIRELFCSRGSRDFRGLGSIREVRLEAVAMPSRASFRTARRCPLKLLPKRHIARFIRSQIFKIMLKERFVGTAKFQVYLIRVFAQHCICYHRLIFLYLRCGRIKKRTKRLNYFHDSIKHHQVMIIIISTLRYLIR